MAPIDYQVLYGLQDQVLAIIFSTSTSFYLTGGTCLHRFYLERRYSDDLDLFSNDNSLFRDDVRLVKQAFKDAGVALEVIVDSRDFVRWMVAGKLKVDFVNDRLNRAGKSIRDAENRALDNITNLGANKICAILGRDDPKDIFDIYTIYRLSNIDWPAILAAAAEKCSLDMEELRFRLESFPHAMLDILPVTDQNFLTDLRRDYLKMVAVLLNMPNSQP